MHLSQVGVVVGLGAWLTASHQLVGGGLVLAYGALLIGLFLLWRDQVSALCV